MKIRSLKIYLLILSLNLILAACVNHNLEDVGATVSCDGFKTVSFNNDVKPIITSKCAISGCHNGDNGSDLNWLILKNLQTRADVVKRRITLPASDAAKMPLVGEITADQIQLIVCWVEQGANDN